MKIAMSLFRYFPFGGLQRDMMAIAAAMNERGHQVTIYTRDWQGERPADIPVVTLGGRGLSNHARDRDFAARLGESDAGSADRLVGFNKMPGLDCYYAADGCLAARYAGQLKARLPRYRERLAMEAAVFRAGAGTRILSISPPQKALYRQFYGTEAERFCDLPPGIRRDRVAPADYEQRRAQKRRSLGIDSDNPVFLFIGSGFRTKGLDRALHAFAKQADQKALLFVIGHDKPKPYRRLAAALGVADRVRFMGGQEDIPDWLFAGDMLLHPAYAENTGTVLLEAAVAGLPVVTTDVCGYAPWLEESGMGEVVASVQADTDNLAAAMERLGRVPRDEWAERGRAFADSADIFSLVDHAVDCIVGEVSS